MEASFFDNRSRIVKDDLVNVIHDGDVVSVAAATFSMYAYGELKEQLEGIEEFRFIYTSEAFTGTEQPRERREFYIPRLGRERGLLGTDLEVRLRNELTQKAIAAECSDWIRRKARFKSFDVERGMANTMTVASSAEDVVAYTPFESFTASGLGVGTQESAFQMVMRGDTSISSQLLATFEQAWASPQLHDVTEHVLESMEAMYRENAPELVYYYALYRIFHEFLDDVSQDELPREVSGFRDSLVWNALYDFQRDAVLAVINKLERYRGCILADSVGLGKTFSALAVIKYYNCRNDNVLVLCPKKLRDNWMQYGRRATTNPFRADRLDFDVLYHTDLSRDRGLSETMGVDLAHIDWSNYDLVVIDESHNFRNGEDTSSSNDDGENRYQRLMNRIVQGGGIKTKVLMLSATPVNNRFRDLRNQLKLAYAGDEAGWEGKMGLSCPVDDVFRHAQAQYTSWMNLPPGERDTQTLVGMLDSDFFKVLDQVTVARSRKHVQRYYDMSAIGQFPRRETPVNRYPVLSTDEGAVTYDQIAEALSSLNLSVYRPSAYLLPSRAAKYGKAGRDGNLSQAGRELGIQRLMFSGMLKRLESSIHAFRKTLSGVLETMRDRLTKIDEFKRSRLSSKMSAAPLPVEADEWDEGVSTEAGDFDIADLDWIRWERDIEEDVKVLKQLLFLISPIDAAHDAKLAMLTEEIRAKAARPLNGGNRKVIVFTAFADTADYLYENVSAFAKRELGMETAEVTGNARRCTLKAVGTDMGDVLTCFSPISKNRATVAPRLEGCDVDVLIATDCISEGQNLQDCDYLVNYDIHWNPVRIVQRFGRVDRIGSRNESIQLVNYWPCEDLDAYLDLKQRVESRMRITVMTSTGDDDYLNAEERGDLEYRSRQLRQMREEVVDLEDVSGGVSITDLGLNEFRMDLAAYYRNHPELERVPAGIAGVVGGPRPGTVFVLRNVNQSVNPDGRNRIHPFYLVRVGQGGEVEIGHLEPKAILDDMRLLCRGKAEPDQALCRAYNRETRNGRNMAAASERLRAAVRSIADQKEESDVDSFFSGGITGFLENDIAGLDDFELVCFLEVRPC